MHTTSTRLRCGAHTRSGSRCRRAPIEGTARCHLHGGRSTGIRSEDGRQRWREARERWLRKLRGMGLRPGPKKGSGGRPNKKRAMLDPIEQQRRDTLTALDVLARSSRSMP